MKSEKIKKEFVENDDPLIDLRRIREERAIKFNYDMKKMFEDIKRYSKERGFKTVSPAQRSSEQEKK